MKLRRPEIPTRWQFNRIRMLVARARRTAKYRRWAIDQVRLRKRNNIQKHLKRGYAVLPRVLGIRWHR